jgi:hypothetical protein
LAARDLGVRVTVRSRAVEQRKRIEERRGETKRIREHRRGKRSES